MVKQEIKSFTMDCGEHTSLPCTAPCTLYSVLCENDVIGDPVALDNVTELSRFASLGCVFTAEFEASPLIISMKNVLLRFHGLDTECLIELNGHEIAKTDNMHLTYNVDVKSRINLGMNTLRLTFKQPRAADALRKAYFALGTESTPKISDMGIYRGIEIVAYNHKMISGVKVRQIHSEKTVRLDLSVSTEGYDEFSRAVATLTSPAGQVYFCGLVDGEGSITVTNPNLWNPNGLGLQNLYRLNVNLYSESEIEDTWEMNVGLRSVQLDESGASPRLIVNGMPVFVSCGEYMCEDIVLSRLTPRKTRELLVEAQRANFNSILIHGSGCYPEKHFFDTCDELGLMVFTELPVKERVTDASCSLVRQVRREIVENLERNAYHPSMCAVIGNSTVAPMLRASGEALPDFEGAAIFDLDGVMSRSLVRVGYSSLCTYSGVLKFTQPKGRNVGSTLFELHGADRETVTDMISRSLVDYPYPNGMKELAYVTGLTSAELCMREVEALRRSADRPLGVLMRCMNDSWPSVSTSALDYYGGKKPLHFYEREFLAPVRISAVQNGTRIKFVVSNDTRQDYVGVFAYQIMNNENKAVFRDSFPIRARAASNLEVHNVDIGSVIRGHENEYYLSYSVADKCRETSKGLLLFTNIKRFKFQEPNCYVTLDGTGMDYTVTVSSDKFVKGVEVSFDGEDVTLDNNYFDITGPAPVCIKVTAKRAASIVRLRRLLKVRTVMDLGNEGDPA